MIYSIIQALIWIRIKFRPKSISAAKKYLVRSFQVTGLYAWQDASPVPTNERLGTDLSFADPDILETFERINSHLGTSLTEAQLDLTIDQLADHIIQERGAKSKKIM